MTSLSLEKVINCLVAVYQIRLKLALAHIKVDNESMINLLVESYQQFLNIQKYSLYFSATPDYEEYIHFFQQVKNSKIQEYKLELG